MKNWIFIIGLILLFTGCSDPKYVRVKRAELEKLACERDDLYVQIRIIMEYQYSLTPKDAAAWMDAIAGRRYAEYKKMEADVKDDGELTKDAYSAGTLLHYIRIKCTLLGLL